MRSILLSFYFSFLFVVCFDLEGFAQLTEEPEIEVPYMGSRKILKRLYLSDIYWALVDFGNLDINQQIAGIDDSSRIAILRKEKKSYLVREYQLNRLYRLVYIEYKNGKFRDRYSFDCRIDNIGQKKVCGRYQFKTEGNAVLFDLYSDSSDPVYNVLFDSVKERIVNYVDYGNLEYKEGIFFLVRDGEYYNGFEWVNSGEIKEREVLYNVGVIIKDKVFMEQELVDKFILGNEIPFYFSKSKEEKFILDEEYMVQMNDYDFDKVENNLYKDNYKKILLLHKKLVKGKKEVLREFVCDLRLNERKEEELGFEVFDCLNPKYKVNGVNKGFSKLME